MFESLFGSNSVGFLTLHNIDASYLGSLLITNCKGIPEEFRCTSPIMPDDVQRSLYGEAFLSHIGVEICGKPLIRSVGHKPNLIFVNRPFLLYLNGHTSCPIVFVQVVDTGETPTLFGSEYQSEVITPSNSRFKTVEIVKKIDKKGKIRALVEQLLFEFDVTEPFERMKKAVETMVQKNALHS